MGVLFRVFLWSYGGVIIKLIRKYFIGWYLGFIIAWVMAIFLIPFVFEGYIVFYAFVSWLIISVSLMIKIELGLREG